MAQHEGEYRAAPLPLQESGNLEFGLDKVTAPLEGGFESKVRNLGNVSYIGSTEQLEATSQSLEAEARETECLRIIAEIPQLKEDLPILRGLPSTQFISHIPTKPTQFLCYRKRRRKYYCR
jgi:hypothetical protein